MSRAVAPLASCGPCPGLVRIVRQLFPNVETVQGPAQSEADLALPAIDTCPTQLLIHGEFRDGAEEGRFPVLNPATEEVLTRVADGTLADADDAVNAAAAALPGWAATPPRVRGEILRKAFDLIMAQEERYARLITLENG